jgi:hypothetical protein
VYYDTTSKLFDSKKLSKGVKTMGKLALKKSDNFKGRKGPLLLIIMDGIGFGQENETNAVYLAKHQPLINYLKVKCVCLFLLMD